MTTDAPRRHPARRTGRRFCGALALVAGLTGATGCSGSPSPAGPPSGASPSSLSSPTSLSSSTTPTSPANSTDTTSPTGTAGPTDAAGPPGTGSASAPSGRAPTEPVPAELADIEAKAEDIIDQLDSGGWSVIAADLAVVEKDWAAFGPRAAAAGIPDATAAAVPAALAALRTATSAKDTLATMQAANDVSAAAVEMFDRYAVGRPVQIGRMDVTGRQLVIDAGRRDFTAARRQLDRAALEISAVAASLSAHRGGPVLARARSTLGLIRRGVDAKDAAVVTGQAKVLLELVDSMEKLYG